jgi:hypothetical protein
MDQQGNLAMFAGRIDDGVRLYRQAGELYRAAGEDVLGVLLDLSICQVITYGGRAAEAATRTAELLEPVRSSGSPSALAYWHFVAGEAAAMGADPAGALAAYTAAMEHAARADNRLVAMLARSSAVTLLRGEGAGAALEELGRVLDQWEDLGNEASAWWPLLSLAVLMAEEGRDHDAALLAGAVLAHRHRHLAFVRDRLRFDDAVAAVRQRLGNDAMDARLAEGARLDFREAMAEGRRVIRAAALDRRRSPDRGD